MCDTFVMLPEMTADGSVIFGKNSDREPNEAQALEYHPAQQFPENTKLKCTYREIPQIRQTRAVLISRPFWMWGAEIGANEKGVTIGNEAVFTKMPLERGEGSLTGMDLLRLALERGDSAQNALNTIVQLLSDYGQGGICGYTDKKLAYHNSYIIADPREAWVLETAGPIWAAKQVVGSASISNGLTIGTEYDMAHPGVISTARQRGWNKKGVEFDFANAYSDWFYTTFSACRTRRSRSGRLAAEKPGRMTVAHAFSILRDHGGEAGYHPDGHLLMKHVCAHAANSLSRNAAQSTASLVAQLKPDQQTFWATGTSAPCTGVFKPVWFDGGVLPEIGPTPGAQPDESLWWRHEHLHRTVLADYSTRLAVYQPEQGDLEKAWIQQAGRLASNDRWDLSRRAFRNAGKLLDQWLEATRLFSVEQKPGMIYRRYWEKQNRRVNFNLR